MIAIRKILLVLLVAFLSCKESDPEVVPEPIPEEEEEVILCEQSICWDQSVYVCRDSTYINLFTQSKGWTGGDATYSVDLKNGKTLWMFGDTFIDQVSEDRSRPSFKLINNSLVLQDGLTLHTFHGGTAVQPKAFAIPPETSDWYWPGDGTIANGKLYLFMHGFGTGGGGAWDFFRTSVDLLTINPETMAIESNVRLFDDPVISWGANIMEDTDYTYVYGVLSNSSGKSLYVARTNEDLSVAWEYFDGNTWSTNPFDAESLFKGLSEQFSVFKDGDVYYFLTQNNIFGKQISLYNASAPTGPFEDGKIVYCTPETGGDIFTYNAFAHDHIYSDSLLVSYNINSFEFNDLLESADNYRPYFVRIGGWRKN
ncbi:MAG: DUF5005 domain-containing protein [Cyclobacteriaceae bacterium]